MNILNEQALSLDQIKAKAPSVFAERAKESVSPRYAFIPTTRVLATLQGEGWHPVHAMQSKARTADGSVYAKHVLRFRKELSITREALSIGDSIPELVVTNSHNGTSAFEFWFGLFRLVCSNGLVVASGEFNRHSVRHSGYADDKVAAAAQEVIQDGPKVLAQMEKFRQTPMLPEEQRAFATSALSLKYEDGQAPIAAEQLLHTRRIDDMKPDLWSTFNIVQENMLRGGLAGRASTGRRSRTREVKSVNENMRLNKSLWKLAEAMQVLKQAA